MKYLNPAVPALGVIAVLMLGGCANTNPQPYPATPTVAGSEYSDSVYSGQGRRHDPLARLGYAGARSS